MLPINPRGDSPLARLAEAKYALGTDTDRTVVNVLTTATRIAQNNPGRFQLLVCNMGANTVYIQWDASVSAANGIPLAGGGGTLILTSDEDGELTGWELWALAASAAQNVLVVEVVAA